ncbi:hypothetical protein Goari_026173, partial [Gossypium aridum]|nr:hypothetical protein [Gossypium aridum]
DVCILCVTTTIDIKLAYVYFSYTVIASSSRKKVHDPWAFYLHVAGSIRLSPIAKISALLPPVQKRS